MKDTKTNYYNALALFIPLLLVYGVVVPAMASVMLIVFILGINVSVTGVFDLSDLIPRDVMLGIAILVAKCTFMVGSVLGVILAIVDTYKIATTAESLVAGEIKSPTDGLISIYNRATSLFDHGPKCSPLA